MSIINLDKIQATKVGNLESVVNSNADMVNGNVCHLGALVTGETELREVAVPDETTVADKEVVLIASPEIIYDTVGKSLKDFVIKQGTACRAYHLTEGDIFQITDDAISGTTVLGEFVTVGANMALTASADGSVTINATSVTPRFKCEVIEKTTLGFDASASTTLQVVSI